MPKKEHYEICIEFQNGTPDKLPDRNERHTDQQVHKSNAQESNHKIIAAEDPSFKCYVFVLQTGLPDPYGEHSFYYYRRNFEVFNLTLTDLDKKLLLHLDLIFAKRGDNKISSCL